MKKQSIKQLLLIPLMVGCICLFGGQVQAAEGGQAGHEGVVEFYEDSTEPSTSTPPSSEPISSDSIPDSAEPVKKPGGTYPQTGEVIQKSLALSGGALLVLAGIFFVKRKRKEEG